MTELSVPDPQVTELEAQASRLLDEAVLCEILDVDGMRAAEQGKTLCDDLDRKIEKEFKPTKDYLNKALKEFRDFEQRHRGPAKQASGIYEGKILAFRAVERQRLEKEEAERQQVLRKQEEERRLSVASNLEKQGRKVEAARVVSAPIVVPKAEVALAAPDGHVEVRRQGVQIDDKMQLVNFIAQHPEYEAVFVVNEAELRKLGRAKVKVPGVTFFDDIGLSRRRTT